MKNSTSLSAWIFVLFFSFFALISSGRFGGDGLNNYLTAESIVLDGDFSIHDRPFGVAEMRHSKDQVTGEGVKRYSQYGLAVALLLVPFYYVGHLLSGFVPSVPHDYITQFAVSFFNPVVLALLALTLFRILVKLGYSERISFFTTVIYSLCTMNVIYARSGFSEPIVALLVVLAAYGLLTHSKSRSIGSLLAAAAAIGYTLFIKKNSFILFPAFGAYFLFLLLSDRKGSLKEKAVFSLCFLAPIMLALAAIFAQNKILYGGLLITEHGTIGDTMAQVRTDGYPVKGLYYYLISSGKGYFLYNIALILGLFSIRDFFIKYRSYALFILGLLLFNLLVYSFIFVRGSLFSWGPRYLFPTLPLFAFFLAEFMSKKNILKRKVTVLFFALLGFMVQLPVLLMNFSKYLFFVKEKLGLDEYLIDFMPELSPIRGVWVLFLSMIHRIMSGTSLNYSFNPDLWFFKTINSSFSGYDIVDVWWINILRVKEGLFPAVTLSVLVLLLVLGITLKSVISSASGKRRIKGFNE